MQRIVPAPWPTRLSPKTHPTAATRLRLQQRRKPWLPHLYGWRSLTRHPANRLLLPQRTTPPRPPPRQGMAKPPIKRQKTKVLAHIPARHNRVPTQASTPATTLCLPKQAIPRPCWNGRRCQQSLQPLPSRLPLPLQTTPPLMPRRPSPATPFCPGKKASLSPTHSP